MPSVDAVRNSGPHVQRRVSAMFPEAAVAVQGRTHVYAGRHFARTATQRCLGAAMTRWN